MQVISGRAIAACCLAWALAATAPAAPSVADFASDGDFSTPTLSPDGNKLAYVTRVGAQRVLMAFDLDTRERVPLVPADTDDFELRWCSFKNDERLLCGFSGVQFMHGDAFPVSRLLSVDVTGRQKAKVLVQNSSLGTSQFQDRVLDWQVNDPRRVLIQVSVSNPPFPDVHSLDVYTGLTSIVQRSRVPILRWSADRQGVLRFGAGFTDSRAIYIARDAAGEPWRTLAKWERGGESFQVLGFGAMPGTMLVEDEHNGRKAIFEMDLSEKNDRQLLFSNPEVDVDEPIYWPVDHRIVGFAYETEKPHRQLFDQDAAAIYGALDQLLPNAWNEVIDASRDGKKLLVSSRADIRPTDYYVLDLVDNKLRRVGSTNPALARSPLSPQQPVRIKGPDGLTLPGYLTLPLGSTGANLPTVIYPHGGPYARDTWGYDAMVQFMASRGYAVVQVNFRGSTGYGESWFEAGLRNWGTVMVDDVTAAARWAIDQGIADPKRTCIVGWSFGGYAALMSAVRENQLYKCVVSIAGVADLRALVNDEKRFYGGRYRARFSIGSDADELKAGSPLRAAERIKAPVLLIHGDDDVQVAYSQSERMARALKNAHKQYELVIVKDGNHSLTRAEWRTALYTKLEEFLARNL
ncbi:MAG TPA: S9 family peptidase [Steroidobacteraceae bacterium]|nr:S9 family peptidase [Steroidobacteraceae bacterium]